MSTTDQTHFAQAAIQSYKRRMQNLAGLQLGVTDTDEWRAYWPKFNKNYERIAHHSEYGSFRTPQALAKNVDEDRKNRRRAICVIEGVTLYWAAALGSAWNLDPQFFLELIKEIDLDDCKRSLQEARAPNSIRGLKSTRNGPWATVRGVISHGDPKDGKKDIEPLGVWNIRVQPDFGGGFFSHTNMSVYAVNEYFRKLWSA